MSKVFDDAVIGGSGGGTTSAANLSSSGIKLLVVALATYRPTGTPDVPTDSQGNTYTPRTEYIEDDYRVRIYDCRNPSLGSSHTFTVSGSGTYPVATILGFDDDVEFHSENGDATAGPTSSTPGSVTPPADGSVLVTCLSTDSGSSSHTINNGFTVEASAGITGTNTGGAGAWLIQTTAAAINPTWTHNSPNAKSVSCIAVYAPASGGTAYNVGADNGSFTLTGQSVSTKTSTAASNTTFTFSGQDVTLTYAQPGVYTLTAEHGTLSFTGVESYNALGLNATNTTFTITGQDVTLTYSEPSNYTLTAENGVFTLSGKAVNLRWSGEVSTGDTTKTISIAINMGM